MKVLLYFLVLVFFSTILSAGNNRKFLDDLPLVEEVTLDIIVDDVREVVSDEFTSDSLVVYDVDEISPATFDKPVLLNNNKKKKKTLRTYLSSDYKNINTITYDFTPVSPQSVEHGKKAYQKQCRLCHGNSKRLTRKYKLGRIIEAFNNEGETLSIAHDKRGISKLTNKFFKGTTYLSQLDYLKDFLINSAKKQ